MEIRYNVGFFTGGEKEHIFDWERLWEMDWVKSRNYSENIYIGDIYNTLFYKINVDLSKGYDVIVKYINSSNREVEIQYNSENIIIGTDWQIVERKYTLNQ